MRRLTFLIVALLIAPLSAQEMVGPVLIPQTSRALPPSFGASPRADQDIAVIDTGADLGFQDQLAAEANPAAARVYYRNQWCGSASICGYWTNPDGVKGALLLSNAHVSTTNIGQELTLRLVVNGQTREFKGFTYIAAYSRRNAVDWSIIWCPELTADSGIEPLPLSRDNPVGTGFQFTGSPGCVWPLKTVGVRLISGAPDGVVFWKPITIGGQSGSSLWNTSYAEFDDRVAQILLTWSWNGNGAGQPISLVYNNIQNKSNAGPPRPEGLREVYSAWQDDKKQDGYFEAPIITRALGPANTRAPKVADLPIWYEPPTDPVDPVEPIPGGELTAEEIASLERLKASGFDLLSIVEHYESLLSVQPAAAKQPAPRRTPATPQENPQSTWEPPTLNPGEKYYVGQVHNGMILRQRCYADRECEYYWEPINQ